MQCTPAARRRVLLVTTSMGTRWEAYSQTLLRLLLPEWNRLVIDGRRDWSPTGFVSTVIKQEVDFVVHVDEDCFLESRSAMLRLIEAFENDPTLVAAGIPDGGCYYRDRNPAALNLFFTVFRFTALKAAWESRESWSTLSFQPEFAAQVRDQCPHLDQHRIRWTEKEPYYPLFWSMLRAGGQFLYLREELRRGIWSSRVRLTTGQPIAEHLWYLRQWFSDQVMPGHDCSNRRRYESMAADIRARWRGDPRFWLQLGAMRAKALARRWR